jgi:hypothetical protein
MKIRVLLAIGAFSVYPALILVLNSEGITAEQLTTRIWFAFFAPLLVAIIQWPFALGLLWFFAGRGLAASVRRGRLTGIPAFLKLSLTLPVVPILLGAYAVFLHESFTPDGYKIHWMILIAVVQLVPALVILFAPRKRSLA